MNCARVKSYAKINLTLHITGSEGGYHTLDSIVSSVDLCDVITLKKRADKSVTVTMRGMGSESIPTANNNAYKAATAFIARYRTNGADISIQKNIPMGAGLGGSSADAAGVLNGLSKLYNISDDNGIAELADLTGSDTRYMLKGGYARMFGRGTTVVNFDSPLNLNLILITPRAQVSTPQCYALFDSVGTVGGNSQNAQNALISGDFTALCTNLSNALTPAAIALAPAVSGAISALQSLGPAAVNMTGSGCGVYAVFKDRATCKRALSRLSFDAPAYILSTRITQWQKKD